jgi:hypothetical protein
VFATDIPGDAEPQPGQQSLVELVARVSWGLDERQRQIELTTMVPLLEDAAL